MKMTSRQTHSVAKKIRSLLRCSLREFCRSQRIPRSSIYLALRRPEYREGLRARLDPAVFAIMFGEEATS
jgi:hypothetical protein